MSEGKAEGLFFIVPCSPAGCPTVNTIRCCAFSATSPALTHPLASCPEACGAPPPVPLVVALLLLVVWSAGAGSMHAAMPPATTSAITFGIVLMIGTSALTTGLAATARSRPRWP
jgi:hypothetical protein